MLSIGRVQLKTNLLLAPIAGYCDLAFRLVVRSIPEAAPAPGPGCGIGTVGLACTDLLCPQAILRETDTTLWLAATCPEDQPLCMQLYGREVGVMAEAARWAAANGATTIDINMGCPVDKVTKKNGGSKLLCEPELAIEIVRTLARTVSVPVTAKIRLGWDDASLITDSLPPRLADAGAAAITVHGRTSLQKFRGSASLPGIARVVQAVKRHHPQVTVIGNGDVKTPEDAKRMLGETGCDGVMIGRGALGQPWIFRDTAHYLATGRLPPALSRWERAQLVLDHFHHMMRLRGERRTMAMIHSRIPWYSPFLQPWPGLRRAAHEMASAAAFEDYWLAGMERMEQEGEGSPIAEAAAV